MTEYLDFTVDWNTADAVAAYDEVSLWSSMAGQLLLDEMPLAPDMRVLDVGCGGGFPTLEIAQRLGSGSHVVGVDTWRRALGRAAFKRRVWRVDHASLVAGDAVALPFAPGSFDLVVSNLGLNNFADPATAVGECARVLKPGGRLAIVTNIEGHMSEFYDVFAATVEELGLATLLPALETHVRHRNTLDGVRALFASAGMVPGRAIERRATMRFADGSAFLRHYFIKAAFLGAWKEIVPSEARERVFGALEWRLNSIAVERRELGMTIPFAYVEAERPVG